MKSEEDIYKVEYEINKAIYDIKNKHVGADLNEAKRLLTDAGKALANNNLNDAIELAKKSQLAAKPDTGYILSKAKELATNAEKSFNSGEYVNAIELWKKAKEEYERASAIASERNEKEIVDKMKEVKEKINDNIFNAEIAIDNREMLNLVNRGNMAVDEGNRLFDNKEFDKSVEVYKKTIDNFKNATNYAEKRDFKDDKKKIDKAIESVNTSINAALVSKGDFLLKSAEESYTKKLYSEAEEKFSSAINFLQGLNSNEKEIDEMLKRGRNGIILVKIGPGEEKMRTADELTNQSKYYDAKEGYKIARDYFENLIEEASKYGFSGLVDDINQMVKVCTQNISTTTTLLTDVGSVKPAIIPVNDIGKGTAKFNGESSDVVIPYIEKLKNEYKKLEHIGAGGFADVFKATTRNDEGVVAIKVPRNIEKTEDIFFREAQMWQKLNDRNIVKLIKPKLTPIPHLVIEYIDGCNLEEYLKREKRDTETICAIAFDIATAIEHAHKHDVVHGDINPYNILISKTEEVKITDFGLAKVATSSSEARGHTLQFAAKEQIDANKTNIQTDVYQIGLTIYFMFAGKNPFDVGEKETTKERIRTFTPDPPSKYDERVRELDDIIMRCLSKNPADRPGLRELRENIYEFVKKTYNKILPLTQDPISDINIACKLAILAAKCENVNDCLNAFTSMLPKLRNPESRKELKLLTDATEYRINNDLSLKEALEELELSLNKIKNGEQHI